MSYNDIPDAARVANTTSALAANGFEVHVMQTGAEALAWIKETIPAGASVFTGASQTLQAIGLIDVLKNEHTWDSRNAAILAETDPVQQGRLRKEATMADWYLGSVHAFTEQGELVIASASGSQMPSIVYNSDNVVFVVSTKKITTDLSDAIKRLREHVYPLEDARMKETGAPGSVLSKVLIYEKHPGWGRTIYILLVNEDLGF